MQVNVHEAKTRFSKLLERVALGDEVVIAKAGRPVARLVPIVPEVQERHPGSARGDVWAYGFRNPWRCSHDPLNGRFWCNDVGQGQFEEINRVSSASSVRNFGWPCYEGNNIRKRSDEQDLNVPRCLFDGSGIDDPDSARQHLRTLIEERPCEFEDKHIPFTISVGVTTMHRETGVDPQTLIKRADEQLEALEPHRLQAAAKAFA